MYLEQTMQLLQWIETLQEPYQFLVYLLLYVGVPIFIAVVFYIYNIKEAK